MTIEQTRIKERRIELNMTQKEMADSLGISQQAYQQIETGRTVDMRISTLKRLCTILKVSSDWLLGLEEDLAKTAKIITTKGLKKEDKAYLLDQLQKLQNNRGENL